MMRATVWQSWPLGAEGRIHSRNPTSRLSCWMICERFGGGFAGKEEPAAAVADEGEDAVPISVVLVVVVWSRDDAVAPTAEEDATEGVGSGGGDDGLSSSMLRMPPAGAA